MFMTVNAVPGALTAHDIEEVSVKDTEIRNRPCYLGQLLG